MQFGIGLHSGFEPKGFGRLVSQIENLGFSHLWVADEGLYRNPYASLTVAALVSSRLSLGTGVTNPYTRHPALTAASIATIDEFSHGRAVLGLAAGGSAVLALSGAKPQPALAVRDAIAIINSLTGTGRAVHDGPLWAFKGALDFMPLRRVPIFLAATGVKMLRLAGAMADGVILGDAATPRLVQAGLRHVEAGARDAQRPIGNFPAVAWCATSISNNRGLAVDAVKRVVAVAVLNHRYRLAEIGLTPTVEMLRIAKQFGWRRTPASVEALSEVLPEEVIDLFALVGSVEACASRIRMLADEAISQFGVLLRPPQGSTFSEQLRLFAGGVMGRT
ncbi:MAG TPA: LLM class flavin-dependent oxidoreductase [bacterium]|jgi:5,10-methylenetetrahydromethanopterin reductase|nr:LLM class flavin-dependent oxidoreductase [bacterium]